MRELTEEQVSSFHEKGYLRLEGVYSEDEIEEMRAELDYIMDTFASWDSAWRGPWRKEYMDEEEDAKATLVAIHELQNYSAAWSRAVTKRELGESVASLLGSEEAELHHVTLHAKPPDKGAPFPMHQDLPFFPHADNRYVDTLVHLDDADEASGCIKFLEGSHRLGKLEHIRGPKTAPESATDEEPKTTEQRSANKNALLFQGSAGRGLPRARGRSPRGAIRGRGSPSGSHSWLAESPSEARVGRHDG